MNDPLTANAESDEKQTGRIEAFSDGVLAIVITLLALELRVPPVPEDQSVNLITQLLRQWPVYLAFFISFFFILVIWINHHRLFTAIRRSDNNLLLLNGVLLLCVTIIPFGTSLVAEYLQSPDSNVAAIIYSSIFFLTSIFFNALWRYASYKNRLFDKNTDPRLVQFITRQYSFGPVLYLVTILLAVFSAVASLLLSLGMAVFFTIPNRSVEKLGEEEEKGETA